MSEPHKSFFQTVTGVVTAITSLIIAITGLYAATDGFTFGSKKVETQQSSPNAGKNVEQSHASQLAALKRQQEIDALRLAQEKQALLIEKELADLRLQKEQLRQSSAATADNLLSSSLPDQTPQSYTANLSGHWHYTNAAGTFVFVLQQNGEEIILQEFDSYGNNVGNGSGYVQGSSVLLNWVEPYLFVMSLEVEAELNLSASGDRLVGQMYTQGNVVPITFYRQ
ncbi:hypothetical protein [Paraglaciecola aestuariivivens]